MKHKFNLFAGAVTALLLGTSAVPAFADYDDQAEETRDLNVQALAAARGQNGSPMPDMGDAQLDEDQTGVGGPLFEAAPGPNDLGEEPADDDDTDVPADGDDLLPPAE
jgi:hypothetical protein